MSAAWWVWAVEYMDDEISARVVHEWFDRWLAEHDAQVAAQALRDAAGPLMRFDCLTDRVPAGIDVPDDYEAGMNDAGGLLNARADRIAGRP